MLTSRCDALEPLRGWGRLHPLHLHLAALLSELDGREDPLLAFTAALVSHAVEEGHVCLELEESKVRVLLGVEELPLALPSPRQWRSALYRAYGPHTMPKE